LKGIFRHPVASAITAKDKSKRSGTLFCHIEFADSPCVDRAIRLSGVSWLQNFTPCAIAKLCVGIMKSFQGAIGIIQDQS